MPSSRKNAKNTHAPTQLFSCTPASLYAVHAALRTVRRRLWFRTGVRSSALDLSTTREGCQCPTRFVLKLSFRELFRKYIARLWHSLPCRENERRYESINDITTSVRDAIALPYLVPSRKDFHARQISFPTINTVVPTLTFFTSIGVRYSSFMHSLMDTRYLSVSIRLAMIMPRHILQYKCGSAYSRGVDTEQRLTVLFDFPCDFHGAPWEPTGTRGTHTVSRGTSHLCSRHTVFQIVPARSHGKTTGLDGVPWVPRESSRNFPWGPTEFL